MKIEELIQKAQEALNKPENSIFIERGVSISASYNGQIAALGVTIALTGLLPALAMYYQSSGEDTKCDKKKILDIIAGMLKYESGKQLFEEALKRLGKDLQRLKKDVIACSIALKQVVRTYKLEKEEDEESGLAVL